MKVAVIAPFANLGLTKLGTCHMVLTHLVHQNKEYADFYAKEKMFKILDNGAFENELNNIEGVVEAAKIVKADEIILPDIIYDCDKTIEKTEEAMEWLDQQKLLGKFSLMAVPQGSTEREWMKCFEVFYNNEDINTIGLSKLSCPKSFDCSISESRLKISKILNKYPNKEYHLLGGSGSILEEIKKQHRFIRSIDSSVPIHYGQKRISLKFNNKELGTSLDFNKSVKSYNMNTVMKNIEYYLTIGEKHDYRSIQNRKR